jgi:hypothetical protein
MTTPLTNAWIESLKQPFNSGSQTKEASKSSIYSTVLPRLGILSACFSAMTYCFNQSLTSGQTCYTKIGKAATAKLITQTLAIEPNWKDFLPFSNLNLLFQKNLKDIPLLSLIEPKFLQDLKQEMTSSAASGINNDEDYLKSMIKTSDQSILQKIANWGGKTYAEAGQDDLRAVCSAYEGWANTTMIAGLITGAALTCALALPLIKKSYHHLFSR